MFVCFFKNALTIFGEIFDLHVSGVYKDLLTAPEAKESHIRFSSSLRWSNHYSGLLGTKGFLSCETFVHVSCIWPVVCYYLRLGLCMSDVKKSLEDTFQSQQGYPSPCAVVAEAVVSASITMAFRPPLSYIALFYELSHPAP